MTDPNRPPDGPSGGEFEIARPRLLGLAYRMLGSLADAEDVVQDAWLRWSGTDRDAVDNPAAWLTTTTTRLALDRIRAVSRRREEYVGPWLPEPVALADGDPAAAAEVAESLTLGFLVVLDALSATERAVFLLADVFGEPFAEIAAAVGKTEDNCRQIAHRARRKVRAARPPEVSPAGPDLLMQLLAATSSGDVDVLLALLDTDVVLLSDGGAERRAARRPVVGATRVARFLVNLAHRLSDSTIDMRSVNGESMVVFDLGDDDRIVFGADVRDGRVVTIHAQRNPAKLGHLDAPTTLR
jgi:RNA polymerase sigma-70 factor (ECF subfamily)